MSLYEDTKDLHHACEQHPLGQSMVSGAITLQQWADWLWAMRVLHLVIDASLPNHMARDELFAADLSTLPKANPSKTALRFASDLVEKDCGGAAYVLHGAHQSGGRVLAPKMAKRGLSTAHVCYVHPDKVQVWVRAARDREDWLSQARGTFKCLLNIMDEIHERVHGS